MSVRALQLNPQDTKGTDSNRQTDFLWHSDREKERKADTDWLRQKKRNKQTLRQRQRSSDSFDKDSDVSRHWIAKNICLLWRLSIHTSEVSEQPWQFLFVNISPVTFLHLAKMSCHWGFRCVHCSTEYKVQNIILLLPQYWSLLAIGLGCSKIELRKQSTSFLLIYYKVY